MTTIDTSNLPSSLTSTGQTDKRSAAEVSRDQFLQLLVTQLKNQDPLNPMENDRFAVDLATFSQLEQLMSINEKISKEPDNTLNSIASYLGTEVVLNSNDVQVSGGNGGRVAFNLTSNAQTLKLQLLDSNGAVVGEKELSALNAGRHSVELDGLSVPDGTYKAQIVGTNDRGAPLGGPGFVSGIVSGFVPGPEPKLLIGNREISPEEIIEVRAAS